MKKLALLIFMTIASLVILIVSANSATLSATSISSGLITANKVVVIGPARLTDLAVYTDGTHPVTVILYDNASAASGVVIGKVTVIGSALNGGLLIPIPVKASAGIYCSISGAGGSAIVFYDPTRY